MFIFLDELRILSLPINKFETRITSFLFSVLEVTMKKKLITVLMAPVCAFTCAFGLVACNKDSTPQAIDLLIAKSGEQAAPGSNAVTKQITYGQTPDLSDYKLYIHYSDGDIKEISADDDRLTVGYSYYRSNSAEGSSIAQLPDEYLAGTYSIEYVLNGNAAHKASVNISVARATSGAFSVEPVRSNWYDDENTSNVALKNPEGVTVQKNENSNALMQTDDSNGVYDLYYIAKEDYDSLTEAQKTDYEFIRELISADSSRTEKKVLPYVPNVLHGVPMGSYMLLATVSQTHNYMNVVTNAAEITVKHPIIDRTFTFQSIVVKDSHGNTVTDPDNEYVYMSENLTEANQGKTVICKANGEVRGTADFGAGVFDEMTADEVYGYSVQVGDQTTSLSVLDNDGETVMWSGEKSGNTLTMSVELDSDYIWLLTFTCN